MAVQYTITECPKAIPAIRRRIVQIDEITLRSVYSLPAKVLAHCDNWGDSVTTTANMEHESANRSRFSEIEFVREMLAIEMPPRGV